MPLLVIHSGGLKSIVIFFFEIQDGAYAIIQNPAAMCSVFGCMYYVYKTMKLIVYCTYP